MQGKVVELHEALREAGLPHAFGGAYALGLYAQPRPTADLDLNVFVPPAEWARVREALRALGAPVDAAAPTDGGEVRVRWDGTEIHLFLSVDALHGEMERGVREVEVEGARIPLVAPEHLVVRKLLLGRDKDRADVEALRAAGLALDEAEIDAWLERLG